MSKRNGDRARFQKDRKRKMLRRQRLQTLLKAVKEIKADQPRPPALRSLT